MTPSKPSPRRSLNAEDGRRLVAGVTVNGIGAAMAAILVWILGLSGLEVPAEVSGAFTVLFTGAMYLGWYWWRAR